MAGPRSWVAAGVFMALAAFSFRTVGAETPLGGGAPETVRLLDVPYVPQSEALCGGAAIAMVLRCWGEPAVLAEDFATLVEPDGAGIRADALVGAIRARGWTALPVTGTPGVVREHLARGRPVVTLLEVSRGVHHYVVVLAWANGGVIFHDPADVPFRAVREQAFDVLWAGAGRWALLILPPERAPMADTPDSTSAIAIAPASLTGCDVIVEDAIQRAHSGDTVEAERRLLSAEALCPESAAPLRGLAGLRFMAKDWAGAARLAEQALARDAEDHYTWRLLAGSRFLLHDEEGALRAWNRISEPRADLARIDGLDRIRYRAVQSQLGLPPGRVLTSRAFARARRRLAEMPASSDGRLSLRPLPQGLAQVDVALLERPLLFDGPLDVGGTSLRALVEREVTIHVGSPMGHGELWTVGARWQEERPAASLTLTAPAPGGHPGIWRVEGSWERQAYAAAFGPDAVVREERRRTALSYSDWIDSNLRLELGTAFDKWSGRGGHLVLEGKMEVRVARDRLALRASAATWRKVEGEARFEAGG
ncbi:MAG TPA: C39 family peptidase, partial [Candidatus Eisenbacteria bacterium]|nr:C39 family peptidase [Candidatus Eisenbacteria bacterium]